MNNEVTKDQFTVVLEGIRSDFKVFTARLTTIEEKVDRLQKTVDIHTEQLAVITGVVKQHSVTLQEHGGILKQHTQALARLEADVKELKERAIFTPNAQVFDKRIEVLEEKVSRIEETLKK